ncbi:RhuM family protein [Flavobacterium sp. 7E]|uniref:RhuM family protein n=1 Tax=Flavobacterium sp. 7E TaxID=2735898 RepID=UPI00352E0D4B
MFEKGYFTKQLHRVRPIRTRKCRIHQQITDILVEYNIDYNLKAEANQNFYDTFQKKIYFAITIKIATEIIYKKWIAKTQMGLTTFKNAQDCRISNLTAIKKSHQFPIAYL